MLQVGRWGGPGGQVPKGWSMGWVRRSGFGREPRYRPFNYPVISQSLEAKNDFHAQSV